MIVVLHKYHTDTEKYWYFSVRYIPKNIGMVFEVSVYTEKISVCILRFRYIPKKYWYGFWSFGIYRSHTDTDFQFSVYTENIDFSKFSKQLSYSIFIYTYCVKHFIFGHLLINISMVFEVSVWYWKILVWILRFWYIPKNICMDFEVSVCIYQKNIGMDFEVSVYTEKIPLWIFRFRYIPKSYRYQKNTGIQH